MTKRGIKLTRLTAHKTSPVITASNPTVAVKAVRAPVTDAPVTTIRHAFRPTSIAATLRITYTTAVASQAIAPRTALTSLTPPNLTPVVARRGPETEDPEREFNRPVLMPVPLTTRLTLTTLRLTNLS